MLAPTGNRAPQGARPSLIMRTPPAPRIAPFQTQQRAMEPDPGRPLGGHGKWRTCGPEDLLARQAAGNFHLIRRSQADGRREAVLLLRHAAEEADASKALGGILWGCPLG